jgi:hypothetical protein
MENRRFPFLIEVGVLLYCLWQSTVLFRSWGDSPLDYGDWIPFLIWCSPVIIYWLFFGHFKPRLEPSYWLIGGAILMTLLGALGSLNAANYFGFALAIAALIPPQFFVLAWICLAVSWMPLLGWFATYYVLPVDLFIFRIILSCLGAFIMLLTIPRRENES